MTMNVHLRKVDEKQYRLFKSAAAKKSISLSKAFEEAISTWALSSGEISEDQVMNDLTYRKMKKKLELQFPGKYVIIADRKLLGVEDSLENAWTVASFYENALVTRFSKKLMRARILGSSLKMAAMA